MSHSTTSKKTATAGYIWLAIAVLIIIAGIVVVVSLPPAESPHGAPGLLLLAFLLAAFPCYWAIRALYDAQPLPTDPVSAPPPLQLDQDQPWRGRTSLRYLENLKKEAITQEDRLQTRYKEAIKAYNTIHQSSGRIEYDRRLETIQRFAHNLARDQKQLAELTDRLDRLFAGDTGFELHQLEELVQKLQRNRQECERELREVEAPCKIQHKDDDEVNRCESERNAKRSNLHQRIHHIDLEIIELQTHLKELKEFDFKRLYYEMGLTGPSGLLSLDTTHLHDIKGKAEIITTIPTIGPKAPPAPELSEDELRRRNKAKWEVKIDNLRTEKKVKMAAAETPEERVRWENIYDDEIRRAEDQWRKHLS